MEKEQQEQYEYARRRINQKKGLYFHFVVLFLGSLFLFMANKFFDVCKDSNWYLWLITIWAFIFIFHFIKVFITDLYMNKNWERVQIEHLMEQQKKRMEQLQKKVDENTLK